MEEIDTIEELLSLKKDLKNTSYKDKLRCIDNAISFIRLYHKKSSIPKGYCGSYVKAIV